MNALRTTAVALAIAAAATTTVQAGGGKAASARPTPTFLGQTLQQLRAEHRAEMRRGTQEALVTLRSQGATAIAKGAQGGASPTIKSGS